MSSVCVNGYAQLDRAGVSNCSYIGGVSRKHPARHETHRAGQSLKSWPLDVEHYSQCQFA